MTEAQIPVSTPPIEAVLDRIDQISTLPLMAMRVIELANDPESTPRELKIALESDPSLCARVLRCVNSAAFMLRSKITNLQQAISYIGFNQVRNLAITALVSDVFKHDSGTGRYSQSGLWRHMISVGACARLIALRCQSPMFEDAFLAGLLHDIGIILEDQHHHEPFRAMIASMDPEQSIVESERAYLGYDHTQLGARIAEIWKFPPPVRAAIEFHHASELYQGEHAQIVQWVEVSNFICNLKGISSISVMHLEFPNAALQALELDRDDLVVIADDLDRNLDLQGSIFEM